MSRQIFNTTKSTVIARNVEKADTFASRMKGLLDRDSLNPDEGLIITQCQSIHMLFMKFPLDAVFVDRGNKVVGLVNDIQPFSLSPIFWNSSYVVELNVGAIEKSKTALGDVLEIKE